MALTRAFHSDATKQAQWAAYLRKGRLAAAAPGLDEVTREIEAFVMPVIAALVAGTPFERSWPPGGPWAAPRAEPS